MNVRQFIMRHPRPVAIKVERHDGEAKLIHVDPKVPWTQTASYICELEPTFVECLDGEGKVLRGTDFESLDDGAVDVVGAPASTPIPAPARLPLPNDPQSATLVLFAQLIADGYRHSTDVAFDRMLDLFEMVARRGEAVERSLANVHKILERLTMNRIESLENAENVSHDDPGLFGAIVQNFAAGAAQAQQAAPAPRGPRPAAPPRPQTVNGTNHA